MFKLNTLKPMRSKAFVHYFRISHPFYDVSHTWLSAVVSFRAFQIPCLAIQTLILNFALLVIRFLLLHSIPQWIYLLYHLTHVFIHKFVSMPSYWNCLNLGNLITFQCVIHSNLQFTLFKRAVCSKMRFIFGKLSFLLLRIRFT